MRLNYPILNGAVLGSMLLGMTGPASAGQFYIGAQATNISAELEYSGATEEYNLNPVRLELGWKKDILYVAAHILTSGSDTATDVFGSTYEMETDTSFGLFVGGSGKYFYGALGLQTFDTTYRPVGFGVQDSDNVLTIGGLLGAQYELTSGLYLYGDFAVYAGQAEYPTFFSDKPDFTAMGLAGGLKYAF